MRELEEIMSKLIYRIDYAKRLDFTTRESRMVFEIVNEYYNAKYGNQQELDTNKRLVKSK